MRAAQRVASRPVDGELDGELMQVLHEFWPTDNAAKRAVRSTPAWRAIPGQLTPNFNVKEFACKDSAHTPYIGGLMKEQGLGKKEARMRAKGLAKRLGTCASSAATSRCVIARPTARRRTTRRSRGRRRTRPTPAATRWTPATARHPLERHRDHARQAFECGIGYCPKGRGYFIHSDFDKTLGRRTW